MIERTNFIFIMVININFFQNDSNLVLYLYGCRIQSGKNCVELLSAGKHADVAKTNGHCFPVVDGLGAEVCVLQYILNVLYLGKGGLSADLYDEQQTIELQFVILNFAGQLIGLQQVVQRGSVILHRNVSDSHLSERETLRFQLVFVLCPLHCVFEVLQRPQRIAADSEANSEIVIGNEDVFVVGEIQISLMHFDGAVVLLQIIVTESESIESQRNANLIVEQLRALQEFAVKLDSLSVVFVLKINHSENECQMRLFLQVARLHSRLCLH